MTEPSNVVRLCDFRARQAAPRKATNPSKQAMALFYEADAIDTLPARQIDAEHLYRAALALDPALVHAYINLGACLCRRGDNYEAEKALRAVSRSGSAP